MAIEALTSPSSTMDSMKNTNVTKASATTAEPSQNDRSMDGQSGNHPYDPEDPFQIKNTQNVSTEKIKKAVDQINQRIKPTHTSCQYSYHEETNRITIKVIDDSTEEIIREIPPEKTLDMIARTLELEGMLVDEKR